MPRLIETVFGWVTAGPYDCVTARPDVAQVAHCSDSTQCPNDILSKFWQIEELPSAPVKSPQDEYCEKLYHETTVREKDGRFKVNLPIPEEKLSSLGNSFKRAYSCFMSLESRLIRDQHLYDQYREFIREFIHLGHAEYIDNFKENDAIVPIYYLPHHAVIRPQSVSTKLRTVFNASSKTSTGVSLNDIMYEGPNIFSEITDIILRFRTFQYVFSADIVKMFRQIKINETQRSLQRILWRDSSEESLKCIQLNTVTYGTKSAPYLAFRTLLEIANIYESQYPDVSKCLRFQCYMDDVLYGSNTIEDAIRISSEVSHVLADGQFLLHKWSANNKQVLENLPEFLKSSEHIKTLVVDSSSVSTLGLKWDSESDNFILSATHQSPPHYTKRSILSSIARIFDPMGFLAPFIISGKILMQKIWKENLNWDDDVPKHILLEWHKFQNDLETASEIVVSRKCFPVLPDRVYLVGFSDAASTAYGACAYLVSVTVGSSVSAQLVIAKSRVAPLKALTIPRLELSAALLLSRLVLKVKTALSHVINIDVTYLFSDSNIVLNWIKSPYEKYNSFICNRVSQIIANTENKDWFYVNTHENPADLLTRGISLTELKASNLWWFGPHWLSTPESEWRLSHTAPSQLLSLELSKCVTSAIVESTGSEFLEIFSKFSKFTSLQRAIAYVFRFCDSIKSPHDKLTGYLSTFELRRAHDFIIRTNQHARFAAEIRDLNAKKSIKSNSKLLKLCPILDEQGLLRLGGRISNAFTSFNHKHPIIIPQKDHVTTLIIRRIHLSLFHAGIQTTLSTVRLQYWPINGRAEVKNIIHSCAICIQFSKQTCEQRMADLPAPRVNLERPFLHTGVDFTGHILVKSNRLRNAKYLKGYICLFVCLSTKCVHLEVVSDMSSSSFILALKRFVSRRGLCHTLYSDNGSNFRGAHHELNKLYKMFRDKKQYSDIMDFTSLNSISWKFTVPLASHMGGIYEAGIKAAKNLLKRQLVNVKLPYEELMTVVVQIEGILNSRPLCALSDVPNDLTCLTPAHFLIGNSVLDIPEPNFDTGSNPVAIWKKLSIVKHSFWRQWKLQYLSELQQRPKWAKVRRNIQVNDLVIIKDELTPPGCWPRARVVRVHTSASDGLVRSATLRTGKGEFDRPINKLILLLPNAV